MSLREAILAFAWLRFREGMNAFTRTRRRGALERTARAAEVVVPLLFWLLFIPGAVLNGGLGFLAGRGLATMPDASMRDLLADLARFLLAILCLSIAGGILLRSVQGTTQTTSRFALLPIPRAALHRLEVAASFADPWLAVLIPAVLLLPVGLASAGRHLGALAALAAGLLLLLFLACTSSLLSHAMTLLLRRRGRRELVALAVFLALFALPFLPMALLGRNAPRARSDHRSTATVRAPAFLRRLPTELYVRAIERAAGGDARAALLWASALGAVASVTYAASRAAYGALLDAPPEGVGRSRGGGQRWVLARDLPLLPRAVAAVASAEVRGVMRSVQGRMAIFLVPLFYAAFSLSIGSGWRGTASVPAAGAGLLASGGIALCLVGLQGVLFNQFGIDRTGLTRLLLAPVGERQLLAGKALGGAILYAFSLAVFLIPTLGIKRAPGDVVVVALLAAASAYLLVAPIAALLSIALPKSADLASLGRGGKPNEVAGLLGTLAALVATVPPYLLDFLGRALLGGGAFAPLLVATWTIFCAGVSLILFEVAVRSLARRREELALAAAR